MEKILNTKTSNKIEVLIRNWEQENKTAFTPSRSFYKTLAIGQKRFWSLSRNEAQPTLTELQAIADYFKVYPKDLF